MGEGGRGGSVVSVMITFSHPYDEARPNRLCSLTTPTVYCHTNQQWFHTPHASQQPLCGVRSIRNPACDRVVFGCARAQKLPFGSQPHNHKFVSLCWCQHPRHRLWHTSQPTPMVLHPHTVAGTINASNRLISENP